MTKKLNFPTVLTLLRIVLIAPLLICFFIDNLPCQIITLLCFILAAATDFIDGRLARKNHEVTDLGAFLDPLADKMLVNLTFLVLVYQNLVPLWIFGVILIRDFAVDGMRMMLAKSGTTLAAHWLGKFKTMFQMFTLTLILLNRIFENPVFSTINHILLHIVVILTLVSGAEILLNGQRNQKQNRRRKSN